MEVTMRKFVCDAAGCKSTCSFTSDETGGCPAAALRKRGWAAADAGDTDVDPAVVTCYCPAHVDLLDTKPKSAD